VDVVVVSAQPALLIALGSQVPNCTPRSAATIEEAVELAAGADALVLLDVGSEDTTAVWLEGLRERGITEGIVLIDAPSSASQWSAPQLERPFSVSELAAALLTARVPHEDDLAANETPSGTSRAATSDGASQSIAGSGDDQAEQPDPPATEAGPLADEASTRTALDGDREPQEPPRPLDDGETSGVEDEGATDGLDQRGQLDSQRPTRPDGPEPQPLREGPKDSAPSSSPRDAGEVEPSPAVREAHRLLSRLRHFVRAHRQNPKNPDVSPEPPFEGRIRDGLSAALGLEQLIADLDFLTDVAACSEALLDEIHGSIAVNSSAVALRSRDDDLQVVSTAGGHAGIAGGRIDLDHPLITLIAERGGTVLIAPTDQARGFLAGVPMSNWPALLAVGIPGEAAADGLVLVGRQDEPPLADLRRLADTVASSATLLRLAAAIWRLRGPEPDESRFTHSWM
jgi:hypothetical protein